LKHALEETTASKHRIRSSIEQCLLVKEGGWFSKRLASVSWLWIKQSKHTNFQKSNSNLQLTNLQLDKLSRRTAQKQWLTTQRCRTTLRILHDRLLQAPFTMPLGCNTNIAKAN